MSIVTVDFVVHCDVLIDAAPSQVWPHIVDTNGWHRSTLLLPVGDRFHAVPRAQPDLVGFHAVNVELEVESRRTMRLETPEGVFMGFCTYTLIEDQGRTLARYEVFAQQPVPAEHAAGFIDRARERVDGDLAALKAVIEGHS
jgi:hypothetical protein